MQLLGIRTAVEDFLDPRGFTIYSSRALDPEGAFLDWALMPDAILVVMKYFSEKNESDQKNFREILQSTDRYWQFEGPLATDYTNGNQSEQEIRKSYKKPVIKLGKQTDIEVYSACVKHMMELKGW